MEIVCVLVSRSVCVCMFSIYLLFYLSTSFVVGQWACWAIYGNKQINKSFLSVCLRKDIEHVPEFPDKVTNENSISEVVIRQSEVLAELHQLNLYKAAGTASTKYCKCRY